MNLIGPTLVLYLLVGAGVAVSLYLSDSPRPASERFLRVAMALPFWPVYLPILLARPSLADASSEDEAARTIAVVGRELDEALSTLEEWIGISQEQRGRVEMLRAAWQSQAERLREMDRFLARPEYALSQEGETPDIAPRVRQSLAARQENLERLRQIRGQAEADLLASIACVRELASRVHLARFTDAPAARAEELLDHITAVIETLSAPPSADSSVHLIKKAE